MSRDEPTRVEMRLISAHLALARSEHSAANDLLFNHAVLCSTSFPYRNPGPNTLTWSRRSGNASLLLQAGSVQTRSGEVRNLGLPFGPRSRLIFLFLCSEAIKTGSPSVEVARSFTAFARSLGIDTNGRALRGLRDQLGRMAVLSLRVQKEAAGTRSFYQGFVFRRLNVSLAPDGQLPLWSEEIEFDAGFFESLRHNAVPLKKEAIAALKHSARAMDIYAWLAFRLFRVKRPTILRWKVLQEQFGNQHQVARSWKPAFLKALKQALYVYPQARVELLDEGLELHRSPPPVKPRWRERDGLLR